jgi:hypothetical protein
MLNQVKSGDKEAAVTSANARTNAFTNEQLQASWLSYVQNITEKGKQSLSHTLSLAQPVIGENNVIHFKVFNAVQESDVQSVLTELSMRLRNDLSNDLIQVKIEVSKDESERKPYTNREKYVRLAQINPNLEKLRTQLDLEI